MKCNQCGKKFDDLGGVIDFGTCHYMPANITAKNYALNGRLSFGIAQKNIIMSEQAATKGKRKGKPPRPICADCFLSKLRRAVVALETALEGRKSIDPDPDEKPQETKPAETQQEPAEDRSFEDAVWAAFDK